MWVYAWIPVVVATLGAVATTLRPMDDRLVGGVQHLAAGVIFYAAAGELLPDAVHQSAVWPLMVGGAIGIAAMLLLRKLTARASGPMGLVGASVLDALVDGLVLGLGFNRGRHQGTLLAIALAVEFLFLGLSIAGAFDRRAARLIVVGATAGVSLSVPVGALAARPIAGLPQAWQAVAFSFGLVALLYLVTEELLVEAHEKPETAWGAALFYVGFLGLAVTDKLMGAAA